jgi:hypothetical protein
MNTKSLSYLADTIETEFDCFGVKRLEAG